MRLRIYRIICFYLFVTIFFNSCITFAYQSYEPQNIDNSFSVNKEITETNNIASVLEYSLLKGKPAPKAGILLVGQIKKNLLRTAPILHLLPTVKSQYREDNGIIILPKYRQEYFWSGTIAMEDFLTEATVMFDAYGTENGGGKQFILTNASLGQTKLVFEDPLDVFYLKEYFPFLIGYVHIANSKYRVYAVLDNSPNRQAYDLDIFFNPLQKFQIIDEDGEVIAELEQGKYTIYGIVNAAEMINLKYAFALLVAFKHSASVLRNINDGWEPTFIYRYVFP